MRKLSKASILSTLLLVLVFFIWQASPARAASAEKNGRISGVVVDGSNKQAPLVDQSVTLQMAQNNASHDVSTVKTDKTGKFTFPTVDTDQTITYVIYTQYQGAQYVSNAINFGNSTAKAVTVQVYEATQQMQNIAIVQSNVLVRNPDPAKGIITISQAFSFQNLNPKTFVGSLNASKGKPDALFFSLPAGVRNITLGAGFAGYQVLQIDKGFATNAALLPGSNDFSFSYELPYTQSNYNLSYQTQYPTVALSFLIDPNIHASSAQLTSAGIVNANNQEYHAYKATTLLPAQSTITIALSGLAVARSTNGSLAWNAGSIWLIVGILVLAAIIVMTWFLYRARRHRVGLQSRAAKTSAGKGEKDIAPAETLDPQQKLLQTLLALDQDYAAGKLNKATYEEKRNKTKARLRSLKSEKESVRR
ncbi:carboxypeptidase-like regulatory domain-containing protein [Dictyobacter arantiisoli]|uniref:Carboxypeptidase regulatory-like domain-containing protein n=1 Tax=Dictyobacter arantiisoli TaxID=2014874 RepID=A0A5A5TBD0_9CHLR|nr:carboxypeptidase-like regulatory domain-containing protein [Dictyobacter arantiisoli]GCF08323.1 hypothetical protein KDI_18870 [Dictyobacter arantiisoli]